MESLSLQTGMPTTEKLGKIEEEQQFLEEVRAVPKRERQEGEPPLDVHLVMILDESSSMASQTALVVKGVNDMLTAQRNVGAGRVFFSLVTFSSECKLKIDHVELSHVPPFTLLDYHPSGGTALYDAIGSTIMRLRKQTSVVVVIATDGEENSSKLYTLDRVKMMIKHCNEELAWEFIYICEDLESFKQGQKMGLSDNDDSMQQTARGTIGRYLSDPQYSRSVQLRVVSASEPVFSASAYRKHLKSDVDQSKND